MLNTIHVLTKRIEGKLGRFTGEFNDEQFEEIMANRSWQVPTGTAWIHIDGENDPRFQIVRSAAILTDHSGRFIQATEILSK